MPPISIKPQQRLPAAAADGFVKKAARLRRCGKIPWHAVSAVCATACGGLSPRFAPPESTACPGPLVVLPSASSAGPVGRSRASSGTRQIAGKTLAAHEPAGCLTTLAVAAKMMAAVQSGRVASAQPKNRSVRKGLMVRSACARCKQVAPHCCCGTLQTLSVPQELPS